MKKILLVLIHIGLVNFSYSQTCTNDTCETGEDLWNCPRDCWLDTVVLLYPMGGRVDWAKDTSNLIAFDRENSDGFFDVFTMKPDTSQVTCLTCGHPTIPQKHNGQPAWHPSGNWIVFQVEKPSHAGISFFSSPGRGIYNDLWVMSPDGVTACPLTNLPNTGDYGVLHPHFSNDGTKLAWSQLTKAADFGTTGKEVGSWELHVADFNGCGALTNEIIFQPGDSVFYENHGFSPDDSCLLFTSNLLVGNPILTQCNIYSFNIYTSVLKKLTGMKYNEHASYTPDGSKIMWGTTLQNQIVNPGMDLWIMNPDSTNKQRITYFNKPGHYESVGSKVTTVDHSWNATGDRLVFHVGVGPSDSGSMYMLIFNGPMIGMDEEMENMHLNIYPNPFHEFSTIEFENPMNEIFTLEIVNMMGQVLYTNANIVEEKIRINRNELINGLYFLRLRNSNKIVTRKILIE